MTPSSDEVYHTVCRKLASLGNTPDEVAAALERLGVTGERESSWSCPLANLVDEIEGVDHVSVDSDNIDFDVGEDSFRVATPAALSQFVARFDDGDYPALDEDYDPFGDEEEEEDWDESDDDPDE